VGASRTIHFVSLGCPKNRVDTEVMLGVAEREGWRHVADAAQARVIVVNTCGFIEPAKRESIDTILELGAHKKRGACRRLVVAGCLSQRHPEELAESLPEVDHFLGSSDMLRIAEVLEGTAPRIHVGNPADWVVGAADPRRLSTRGASAYVKLAEGCNRRCAFCVIPALRGKQRSRDPDDVVREVSRLASAGVLEINLVAQDTVAYGRDLAARPRLADLVERVADVSGIRWVRLFYLYPERLDERLVELLAEHPRVLPYVDMPLQHAADAMLRRMRRGHGGRRLRDLVVRLRERVPGLVLRTAFIVGHPGETDAEFEELCDFVRWAEIDRVGVFRYSDEDGAASHELDGKVPAATARSRARRLMALQRPISRRKNRALVGQELEVLVEGPDRDAQQVMVGRHAGQAPEIDGQTFLSAPNGVPLLPGRMLCVRVTQASDYDLVGELVEPPAPRPASRPAAPRPATTLLHRASDGRRLLKTV
jgi:ribosomal protein S12 methylthiotransferase